jgi:hypothetical protein
MAHGAQMRPPTRPDEPSTVLGVEPGASRAEIRRAYRQKALAIHPDVAGHEATAEMAQLNTARDTLLARHRAGEPLARDGAEVASPGWYRVHGAGHAPRPDHQPDWTDHWSAWNDLPRRTDSSGT